MLTKAESLDELLGDIHSAFNSAYDSFELWVVETFDEFVIVWDRAEKTHYKVAYSKIDELFEFAKRNEWEDVKLKKEWVAKFINNEPLTENDFVTDVDIPELDSRYALKTLGNNRVGGYAMLWGDEDSKDLHEEFFTPATKDTTVIFDELGVLPFIVHHASDDGVEKFIGGAVDVLEPDDIGMWFEAKTKEFQAYRQYVKPLIDEQMAYTSTGTLPAAKRVKKSGEITRWPIGEISATWTPAEWRMLEHPISEVKSYFDQLGVETDLTQYDEADEPKTEKQEEVNPGAEKARLTELVTQEFVKLGILEIELQET